MRLPRLLSRSFGKLLSLVAPLTVAAAFVSFEASAAPNGATASSEKGEKGKKKLPPLPDSEKTAAEAKAKKNADGYIVDKQGTIIVAPAEDQPPVELTGALPQAKLVNKKKKVEKTDKTEKADESKADKGEKSEKSKAKKASGKKTADKAEAKAGKSKKVAKKTTKSEKADKSDKLAKKIEEAKKKVVPTTDVLPDFSGVEKNESKKLKVKTCLNPAVTFARLGQPTDISFALTTCKGKVAPNATEYLSILGRPYNLPPPAWMKPSVVANLPSQQISAKIGKAFEPIKKGNAEVSPGIKRLDEGLVLRLQQIADHFPGKTITLVSGYRPKSNGDPHQAGHAFDIRIDGVTNETLVAYCKTLKDTGCGYYPNSYFVHVDVRPEGTGHVFWIDISAPGEKPVYVKTWPVKQPLPQLPAPPKADASESDDEDVKATTDSETIGDIDEPADSASAGDEPTP